MVFDNKEIDDFVKIYHWMIKIYHMRLGIRNLILFKSFYIYQ